MMRRRLEISGNFLRSVSTAVEREILNYDVVVVGGGPSGLSAASRIRQLNDKLSVCVIEKSSEIGGHVLSGAVVEYTDAFRTLYGSQRPPPLLQNVTSHNLSLLISQRHRIRLPTPNTMLPSSKDSPHVMCSLGKLTKWMAQQAENSGVDIFVGFSGSEILWNKEGSRVEGVATGDFGVDRNGNHKKTFARGVEIRAKQTILAEGSRGYLHGTLCTRLGSPDQTYALGLKELWRVPEKNASAGRIVHTLGWPLGISTYGGGFMYHLGDGNVALGLVVGLDYKNPHLNPFRELQRMKHHSIFRNVISGGECIAYGARCIPEGGWQSIPPVTAPGVLVVGDSAGLVNVPKIKGIHLALRSGTIAAEAAVKCIDSGNDNEADLYREAVMSRGGIIGKELYSVRNIRPAFQWGTLLGGLGVGAVESYVLRGVVPVTIPFRDSDNFMTKPARKCRKKKYPGPDGVISFDILSQVERSHTDHEQDQPCHLKLRNDHVPSAVNYNVFAGPEEKYCPANVYEYITKDDGSVALEIHAQNCLHCKACEIKDITQNITWTPPQGGEGPMYAGRM